MLKNNLKYLLLITSLIMLVAAQVFLYNRQEDQAVNLQKSGLLMSQITSCKKLEGFVEKASFAHVSRLDKSVLDSIFGKIEFNKKIITELYHELDPYKLVFLKSDVEKTINNYANYPFFGLCLNFPIIKEELAEKLIIFGQSLNKLDILKLTKSVLKEKAKYSKVRYESEAALKKYFTEMVRFGYDDLKKYIKTDDEAIKLSVRKIKRINKEALINSTENTELLLKIMARSWDSHSQYYSEKEFVRAKRGLKSSFVGIGMIVAEALKGFQVVSVIKNGPADKQKILKEGDVITSIDGHPMENKKTSVLTQVLLGEPNTSVTVNVLRDGKAMELKLIRGFVPTQEKNLTAEIIKKRGKKIGLIKLKHFYSGSKGMGSTTSLFVDELLRLKGLGAEGLVLDLRANSGGVLDEVVNIVGLFFTNAPVVYERGTYWDDVKEYKDSDNKEYFKGPVVVLVDHLSASATEILAGSLKTRNRAVIVGSSTFGKGTIQVVSEVKNILPMTQVEGGLRLTVGYYYLPNGESVQFQGVNPHINLTKEENKKDGLEKTLRYALKKPKKLDIKVKKSTMWMNDFDFTQMLSYIKTSLLSKYKKVNDEVDQKDKAIDVLADMLDYRDLQLTEAVATSK